MGLTSRLRDIRPPLPQATESNDEEGGTTSGLDTDVATNITTQTDHTSYEIPEDGKPIKIATDRLRQSSGSGHKKGSSQQQSQTSLLIEYFEGSRGDKTNAKPSVRVKVTPSSKKRSTSVGSDAIQITGIGKDRKASYTRRISLGSSKAAEVGVGVPGATEISHSSESTVSGRPLEVEVLGSEVSTLSRGLMYAPADSNVSSMPPDSMLEGSTMSREEETTKAKDEYLSAPYASKDRNASRERLTQKVMEKLNATPTPGKSSRSRSARDLGKSYDDESYTGAGSSLLSSNTGMRSYRSGSEISNNPKLLGMVEDTIRKIILPEINAIREDQRQDRNLRSFDSSRRPSLLDETYEKKALNRSLSKSSSTPNISSKPKVVLNRDGEDPGQVLSRGDSERKKTRKSSRGSITEERPSSRRSSGGRTSSRGYDDGDTIRAKSSKSSTRLRDATIGAAGGALLTGAALRSLESRDDSPDQRKRRSKSRGSRRSGSAGYTEESSYLKEDVPPMPMASHINESEVTRSSLVSDATETPGGQTHTPIREVSRGSLRDAASPTSVGASSSPRPYSSRNLGMSHTNLSIGSPRSPGGRSTKDRMAALAAAGVGGAALAGGAAMAHDRDVTADDGYGSPITYRKTSSPAQSVSSLKKSFEEESLKTQELRPKSAASRSSAGRDQTISRGGVRSGASSPGTKLARSRPQSSNSLGRDGYETEYATPAEEFVREPTPGTPTYGQSVDDWYEQQHRLNDGYRQSLDVEGNRDSFARSSNRDSYQTNPYPQDEKRFTYFSEDGVEASPVENAATTPQNVRGIGARPQYFSGSNGAESAVASLVMEPSTVSSGNAPRSAQGSPAAKAAASNSFSARLRELGKDSPPLYQGSTLSQTMPSQDRWQALKGRARDMSASSRDDLNAAPELSAQRELSSPKPVMGASSLPVAHSPIPEAGYYDDEKSEVSTNESIVREPLGGDITGKNTWPYTPDPERQGQKSQHSSNGGLAKGAGLAGAAAAGAAAFAGVNALRQPTVEDEDYDRLTPDLGQRGVGSYNEREATPTSRTVSRDEGYVTDARAFTPEAQQKKYSKSDMDEFNRAMNAYSGEDKDPFVGGTVNDKDHLRNVSGNSHGMDSPLYDSSTGRNLNGIESKDIVALMDHLTVRDAQRNARDTEILVSLVRSAAEMRQSFDDMKRFIVEQDRMIMQSTDRSVDQTVQKALGGPRPQPSTASPRMSQEDVQIKRKGVLRRALKGLTGSKSASDLAKVEGMLMQILDNVEDLKHQGGTTSSHRQAFSSPYANDSNLDTYERLRNVPDSGYEPEGIAGTSSTPSQSGGLSLTPRGEKHQFHSGYDGRRGSVNRVSTVLEGDEDDAALEPHESLVLDHQFERNEGFSTPTQEMQRGFSPARTPTQETPGYRGPPVEEITPRSTEKSRKHKSTGSSVVAGGAPKISRWSKTTTSSAAPDVGALDSPNLRNHRPSSEASRSGSSLGGYDNEGYAVHSDDRLRSTQSLAREQEGTRSIRSQVSKLTRTPSPLIPSEASYNRHEDENVPSPIQEDFDDGYDDDPKYQAHRNSLLLQHPQPRQGTTGRHQNTLETRAHDFEDPTATNSDLSQRSVSDFDPATWGSSGTAGLAKHRLSQAEPLSPGGLNSPAGGGGYRYSSSRQQDDDSLIPRKLAVEPSKAAQQPPTQQVRYEDDEDDYWEREPTYSNSGFSRGGYYTSPYGSGHLLEPIEEVESLLSVERQSPEPTVASARAIDVRGGGSGAQGTEGVRRITGPRPMVGLAGTGASAGGSGSGSATAAQQGLGPARLVETGTGTVRRKPVRGDGYD